MKEIEMAEIDEEPVPPNKKQSERQEDIDFMLWKEELNKELILFWKALGKI